MTDITITEQMTSKARWQAQRERAQRVLDHLYVAYPKAFIVSGPRKPLTIGIAGLLLDKLIDSSLNDLSVTERDIQVAVRIYTDTLRYHKACQAGASRINLDGEVSGEAVKQAQAAYHSKKREQGLQRIE